MIRARLRLHPNYEDSEGVNVTQEFIVLNDRSREEFIRLLKDSSRVYHEGDVFAVGVEDGDLIAANDDPTKSLGFFEEVI